MHGAKKNLSPDRTPTHNLLKTDWGAQTNRATGRLVESSVSDCVLHTARMSMVCGDKERRIVNFKFGHKMFSISQA